MSDQFFNTIVTIATAIIGVAIIAVIVSKQANTAGVLSSAGQAFAQDLSAAVSPVTGGGFGGGFTGFNGSNY
jgi:hypothetical protein